jgi:hypothetical protein
MRVGAGLCATARVSLLLASSAAFAAPQAPWPEMPEPPRAKLEWVAQDVRVNGFPSQIMRFESELAPLEVAEFYRARWSHSAVGQAREVVQGPWKVISTLQGGFQLVVQIKPRQAAAGGGPAQGSEGLLSILNFADAQKKFLPSNWPSWGDMRVTQVTESVDGPRRSQMVAMTSAEGFDLNVRRWRDEWQRRGFALSHEQSSPASQGERSWLASFDQGQQSVDVVVAYRDAARKTFVSVNWLTPAQGARP